MAFRMGGLHSLPKLISTSFRYTSVENNFHKQSHVSLCGILKIFLLNHRWSFDAIVGSDCT